MEFTIKTMAVVILVLVFVVVGLALLTGWVGSGNDMIMGIQSFFENLLAGETSPTMPLPN